MAFIFPEDKTDFVAPNGITYTYRSGKWMMKSYGEEINLSSYVQQDVFDADQSRQDATIAGEAAINETQTDQINLIETQIQLLAKAQAVGKWKYVRNISGTSIRPPATTTFYGTHQTSADTVLRDWIDLRLLMVNKTDLEGTEYTFINFEEGDKIEILATDGTSACYGTLTNNPTQETYGNMIIAVERANGGPRDDKEYILSVYRPGAVSGDVDLDVLDERYLRLTGGTLQSSLKIQRGEEKTHAQYKISPNGGTDYATNIYNYEGQMRFRTSHTESDGDAKGSHIVLDPDVAGDGANPVTKIWKVVTPTSGDMAANRDYVDDALEDALDEYMKLQGRQTTGGEFKLDNGGKSYIHIQTNNTLGLYNLQEPAESHHAATRNYVDTSIAAIPEPTAPDYKVPTGTNTNPSLSAGEMYLNTNNNVLYIGK